MPALPEFSGDYAPLIPSLTLPDADDRHVLAAAIAAQVSVIVTFNLSDFPQAALLPYGVRALHPDAFLIELLDAAPGSVCRSNPGTSDRAEESAAKGGAVSGTFGGQRPARDSGAIRGMERSDLT